MSEPNHDLTRARRAVGQAEGAVRKQPHDVGAREKLVHALLLLIDALLVARGSEEAAGLVERAMAEAEDLQRRIPGDRRAVLALAGAHDRRSRVLDELVLDAEEAGRVAPNAVPDHLPPDPEQVAVEARRAIELLEPLIARKTDDLDALERLASLHGRLAVWLDDHARRDESFGHYRAALVCAERVARNQPRDTSAKAALALAHNALGHHYAEGDQLEDAIRHHAASRALNEWLVRKDPKDSHWRHCLGIDLENLCDAHARSGGRTQALECSKECVRVREILCSRRDATAERHSQLADAHRDVAELSMDLDEPEQALPHYRAMLGILGELAAERPKDLDLQFRLADGQLVLGYALEDQGKLREALAVYRTALETDTRLCELDPTEARWRANTAHCYLCIALVLLDLGDDAGPTKHAEAGLALLRSDLQVQPDEPGLLNDLATFHGELALALAHHGFLDPAIDHHQAALQIDQRLVRLEPENHEALAALALSHDALAALHERRGEFDAAVRHGREAVHCEERLAARDQESVEYRTRLAQALLNLSNSLIQSGDGAGARQELERAAKLIARLARLVPRDDGVRSLRAQVDRALGEALRELGDADAAETHMLRALTALRTLIEGAADPTPFFVPEAESLEALGELRLELGRADEARELLEQALRRRRRGAAEMPDDAQAQRELARTLEALAECCESLGDHESAVQHHADAARLLDRFGDEDR